jgi:nucleotide-binding universal stress UspA family protein
MNHDNSRTGSTPWGTNVPQDIIEDAPAHGLQSHRQVMVCLDRSVHAEICVPYAGFMARALHAELTILHVLPCQSEADPSAFDVLGWEISRREAEQYLAQVREDLENSEMGPAAIHTQLAQGQPAERVLALERELHPELTVLSRRGEGGLASWNLGGTAQRVVMNASGSVLLLPSTGASVVPPHRILVPLDGSQRAESVLPLVLEAARLQDAEVILVHVVSEPRRSGVLADGEDLRLARTLAARLEVGGQAYLSGVRERLLRVLPHVKVRVIRSGDTREALLDAARDEHADLIVLSAHGTTCNAAHPFGSVTAHALAHATLPVLVVQDLPGTARSNSDRPPSDPAPGEPSGRMSLSSRTVAH